MIEQIAAGLLAHLTLMAMIFSVLGVSLGLVFGAMPGLNQGVLMALTLPLTFYMDSNYAQFLLIGMYVGGVSGS
ncbi:MAG: tripartite tricarboxylate transporter permease, partial [Proteobacteria bacterium]|nr:tripartite tricarboxylate transporter permease [Pseudomonadota bacterium]